MSQQIIETEGHGEHIDALHPQKVLGTFGRSTLWLWLDRGGLRVGTALAGLWLVRYLGPADFGVYTTAIAYGAVLAAFLDFGLSVRGAREVGVNREEGKRIIATYVAVTVLAFRPQLILIVGAMALGHWYLAAIGTGFLFINSDTTVSFCRLVLTSELRAKETLPGSLLSAIGMIVVVVAIVLLHGSVLQLLIWLSVKSLAAMALRLWQIRDLWPSRNDFAWKNMGGTLVRSWPYFSYTLIQMGYERVAIVCFAWVATKYQVGLFGAAITIASIYPQWSYASCDAVLPLLTRLFEYRRWDELIDLRQRLLDVLLFVSVPVAVVMCLFAPEICSLLGARYASSALVLRIVAYRSVLSVLDGFLGQAFLPAIGRVAERRNAQLWSMGIAGILILVLGHYLGPIGAGIAILVSDGILLLQYLPICRAAQLPVQWNALWPSLAAGSGMALVALYLPHASWTQKVVPSLAAYTIIVLILARGRVLRASGTLRECFGGR